MATKKREVIEPVAAFFLIERLSKKCLELMKRDWDPKVQLEQLDPLLEMIRDTAKTARYSTQVANKQAMERMIQLGPGLSVRPYAGESQDPNGDG